MGAMEVRGATGRGLRFTILRVSVGQWIVPRGSCRGGACHAGEARARAASARRSQARPHSWEAGQSRRHGDLDTADADADPRAEFEQLETIAVEESALLLAVQRIVGRTSRARRICRGARSCTLRNSDQPFLTATGSWLILC